MDIETYVQTNIKMRKLNRYLYQSLDLTECHIAILSLVVKSDQQLMCLSEIADIIQIDNSVLTKQIRYLINKGFLTKERCEHDMRKAVVRMSEEQKEETLVLMELISEYINEYEFQN